MIRANGFTIGLAFAALVIVGRCRRTLAGGDRSLCNAPAGIREDALPKDEFDIIEVGAWEAGHHEPTGKIVVVFRYSDREPFAFGCDSEIAEELGKGLLALAAEARKQH